MKAPQIRMGQAGVLNAVDESHVEEGDAVRGPAKKRKKDRGVESGCMHPSQEDVRKMLRVVVVNHPAKMAIRIEQGGVKVPCAVNPQKNTGNRNEKKSTRDDRVEGKAKVAAKEKWNDKDERKEFEACRKSH